MNITIVYFGNIPSLNYGGTQRVIWYLGKELTLLGYKITYLVNQGSYCDFANVKFIDNSKSIVDQIPNNTDIVHFHNQPKGIDNIKFPYVITTHGNSKEELDINTIFVSKNHANRYNSSSFVYNGLDWNDYSKPTFKKENYVHFLGKAAWRVKNVKGAINVVRKVKNQHLKVLGGHRFNFKMGIRFTLTSKVSFYGMVGGTQKDNFLNKSKGLIFPVLWNEPFGLAIIESLYFGCPVFGTPYGSLPELVNTEVGVLSNKKSELVNALNNIEVFNTKNCHNYALENFNSKKMAKDYLVYYEKALNNKKININKPKLLDEEPKFLPWNN